MLGNVAVHFGASGSTQSCASRSQGLGFIAEPPSPVAPLPPSPPAAPLPPSPPAAPPPPLPVSSSPHAALAAAPTQHHVTKVTFQSFMTTALGK